MNDRAELIALLDAVLPSAAGDEPSVVRLRAAAERLKSPHWSVLVSGLCSVGKSSVVCALWGDADLVPSAVRDCTQTNTVIREPGTGEADRLLRIAYLSREQALDFALRDLSFYRLSNLVAEILGPTGPRLDEGPHEERIRSCVAAVRQIFKARPDISVLQEQLTDELDKLEQFLAFVNSAAFKPGQTVDSTWDERREQLMGRRHPDGRTFDVGHILSYRHVELVRETGAWRGGDAEKLAGLKAAPRLIDSPWIPTFHNARRAELILSQAREADMLVLISLPEKFEPEPWVLQCFKERPEIRARTLVLFNQVDTVDVTSLFARSGFAEAFDENAQRLRQIGIPPDNLHVSCARLPFLRHCKPDDFTRERMDKLEKVLVRIRKQTELRKDSPFLQKLLAACDPADCGLETLRKRLWAFAAGPVLQARQKEAVDAVSEAARGGFVHLSDKQRDVLRRYKTNPFG